MPSLDSNHWSSWKRAQKCIAQGALTNSKHPDSHVFGVYPTHAETANGAVLFCNGKPYVDYICSLGANLLGHNNPRYIERLKQNIHHGLSHSLPTVFELDTAEKLKEIFYFVDKWKFLKTGTEACMAALKIARTVTGRSLILSEGYHGWSDEFVSLTPPATGVHSCNDILPLQDQFADWNDVAAVIVEPVITDYSDTRRAWLQALREKCTKHGALLIFDEVITGFRFPKFSVSQYFNITPDLILIGKAMAGGLPLAAVGGKAEVMDSNYFVSSTFAGEILSLVGCKAICELLTGSHRFDMDKLWESGRDFIKRFNDLTRGLITIEGYPTRGVFKADNPRLKAILFQEAAKAGILLCNSWFYNFALTAHDFYFFTFLKDFMDRLDKDELVLEGNMPKSPFAERARNGK